MTDSTDYDDFMAKIAVAHPRDFILNHERLEYFGRKHFKLIVPPYVPLFTNFKLPTLVQNWVDEEFKGNKHRKKSLALIGPSKLGKTEWARSLGRHMYFNHLANFKDDWDNDAEYIIFDDFSWDFIPNKKGFFGGQQSFSVSGKYMPVKTVQWGKCCIYLSNVYPTIKDEDVEWYRVNCTFIDVVNKMY